jgi:KDO2-lipid IV(A) lauroyltransferase
VTGLLSRVSLLLLWLLHWLPFRALGVLGTTLGRLIYAANRERRKTTLTNLRLCFPEMAEAERVAMARRHFAAFACSILERSVLWWASPERLRRLIRIEGIEHLHQLKGRPVILLAPHFVGLDVGWTRLTLESDMVTMYARIRNPLLNTALRKGRERFGEQLLVSRQDGLRSVMAAIRTGKPFYYLPDMDYGARDAVFVPFFGMPAATITTMSRLARITGAQVLTVITRRERTGYVVTIGAAWQGFPGKDAEADTRRMNEAIEAEVLAGDGAQYFWSHKRFKTRPEGEKRVY